MFDADAEKYTKLLHPGYIDVLVGLWCINFLHESTFYFLNYIFH